MILHDLLLSILGLLILLTFITLKYGWKDDKEDSDGED